MCVCVCMWDTSYGTQPSVCDLLTHLLTHLIHFLPPSPPLSPLLSSLSQLAAALRSAGIKSRVEEAKGNAPKLDPTVEEKAKDLNLPGLIPSSMSSRLFDGSGAVDLDPRCVLRAACCVLCALVCVECLMFECLVLRAVVCVCCVLCAVWYCMLIQVIPVLLSQQRRPHIAHLLT